MEPTAGTYLFGNVGFNVNDTPIITLQTSDEIIDYSLLGRSVTLAFDMSQRFCIGWGSLATGERFTCLNRSVVPENSHQCPVCQKRTGFNPAFYNAQQVSRQQETRNQEPHFLYLAHFASNVMKVGTSYAKRGNARLLEQGARSALILDTFPTAILARQFEARIATIPHITETIQLRKKQQLLATAYNATAATKELQETRIFIEQLFAVTFAKNDTVAFDTYYFSKGTPEIDRAFDCSAQHAISGTVVGMLGSFLFCRYQGELLYLPLKKFVGYKVYFSKDEKTITLPIRQTSLF